MLVSHSMLSAYPAMIDSLRYLLIGIILDLPRRALGHVYPSIIESLTMTALFDDDEEAHAWLMYLLSEHCLRLDNDNVERSIWSRVSNWFTVLWPNPDTPLRNVTVTTKASDDEYSDDVAFDYAEVLEDAIQLEISPSLDVTQAIRFQGFTLYFTRTLRSQTDGRKETLKLQTFNVPRTIIPALLREARQSARRRDAACLSIYLPRVYNDDRWERSVVKPARPWNSVVLPPGVKELLVENARSFLGDYEFYKSRGVPYRRGYLLHGPPGTGKSSVVAALASELKLSIYLVNLGAKALSDTNLQALLSACPPRSILLIEDIDCAFPSRKPKNDEKHDKLLKGDLAENDPAGDLTVVDKQVENETLVTLSGLLNALDGLVSGEGRLLVCTTNHVDRIDPALSRPGRCDVWLGFGLATLPQAKDLFLHFYSPSTTSKPTSASTNSLDLKLETEKATTPLTPPSTPPSINAAEQSREQLCVLAQRFAESIPDGTTSTSSLQGYFMRYKRDPESAVENAKAWVAGGYKQDLA